MKEKLFMAALLTASFIIGSFLGHLLAYAVDGASFHGHVCRCDLCRTVRQREACQVIDSIVKERIVINFEKAED